MPLDEGRRAIVTAHPDDETLWMGGLPLTYPGDWTVICCSVPTRDTIRAWKLFEAVERLGARARLSPTGDFGVSQPLDLDHIDLSGFDCIVTHGADGEYGHPHHKQVHAFVRERADCEVWVFHTEPCEAAEIEVEGDGMWARKLHALKAYDHVLPYEGMERPKWEALLMRYGERRFEGYGRAE